MTRKIEVVDHHPDWAQQFKEEAARLTAVLAPELVAIYHLGSTAIPGIKAKPVIDIWIEVKDIEQIDRYNVAMQHLGYVAQGENGIPGRRYFRKGSDQNHTHHVHIYQVGSPDVQQCINFRDYLRAHPAAAQAYSHLKEQLARQFPWDSVSYTEGKTAFVQAINQQAQAWRAGRQEDGYQ